MAGKKRRGVTGGKINGLMETWISNRLHLACLTDAVTRRRSILLIQYLN